MILLYKLTYRLIGQKLRRLFPVDVRWTVEGLADLDVYVPSGGHDYWCDGYIENAIWETSGDELTEDELEYVNQDSDFVYSRIEERIY